MKNKNHLKIKYFDLYGLREEKYEFLKTHDVENTEWRELELKEPHFWFVPKDLTGEKKYNKFISVKDIFEKYNAGIATGKDDVLVDFNKQSLARKLLIADKYLFEITMQNFGVKKELISKWSRELKGKDIEEEIKEYNYRVFDKRFVIYNNQILQRSRNILMKHLLQNNLSLVSTKILSSERYEHTFISDCISDRCFISNRGKEANYFFPLSLYEPHKKFVFKGQKNLDIKGTQKELDEQNREKRSNIKDDIIKRLSHNYKKETTPEEIFYYIYAILHSNIYRKKYNEFLKIDFPKIPFAKDKKLFSGMSEFGKELAVLHLLKSEKLENPVASFSVVGNNQVKKREYKEKRVYINDKQYFEGVEPEVWNYCIGGYQVLDKWLKDRIGGTLSSEAVNHYLKIITAIKYTMDLQKKIDEIYPGIEKNLLK